MSAYVFTCPHCRTIVDYSCMCSAPRPITDFVRHNSVDEAKLHIIQTRRDGRPRGEWVKTPLVLRMLGFPKFRRSIYAHAQIGGGWDGFEYEGHSAADPEEQRESRIIFAVIIALCVALWLFATAFVVNAHEARTVAGQPLGWTYGWECCSGMDCSVSGDKDISETPEGYRIEITGEIIPYGDKRIKQSRDEFFHRCTPGGVATAPRSICLYVPNRGF